MKKSIKNVDFNGKKVVVRLDLNVPFDKQKNISDMTRINQALPTINHIAEKGGILIILTHIGRPKGEPNEEYSVKHIISALEDSLNKKVNFIKSDKVIDEEVKSQINKQKPGEIAILENVRFRKEETKGESNFTKEIASLGEIFVNDAFGTSHRNHCSTANIMNYLPSYSGFLIDKEIKFFEKLTTNPERPYVAILGGAKVSDKIGVINNLLEIVDTIVIGGAMAFAFELARGNEVGTSLVERDKVDVALEIIKKAEKLNKELILPLDYKVASEFKNTNYEVVAFDKIPSDKMGLDIGPLTISEICKCIKKSKTVFWNGPMGAFELDNFAQGTDQVAQTIADTDCISIVGGGDSVFAINKSGIASKISHISTGGGSSLEYVEGKKLPGIEPLK